MKRHLRLLSLIMILIFQARAFANESDWLPRLCGRSPTSPQQLGFRDAAQMRQYAAQNFIEDVGGVSDDVILSAIYDLDFRSNPDSERFLRGKGVRLRMLNASTVTQDPEILPHVDPQELDDGRYLNVIGLTRSVMSGLRISTFASVISTYRSFAPEAIIHERVHSLDVYGRPGGEGFISDGADFDRAFKRVDSGLLIWNYCGGHCLTAPEAFAQMFALYNACPASRAVMKDAPALSAFFAQLNRDLKLRRD